MGALPTILAAARIQLSRLGHWMFLCTDTIFRIVVPPLPPDNRACQYSGGQSLGRCVTKLYTLCFLFLIFIFIKAQTILSSTVNDSAPRASRVGHKNLGSHSRAYLLLHRIPYSHRLTGIHHQHCHRALCVFSDAPVTTPA